MLFSIFYSLIFCSFIFFDYIKDKKDFDKKNEKKKHNKKKFSCKKYVIAGILIFFAIFIRSYKFISVPIPLNFDESSIGYEAYSISKYGIDRNGKSYHTCSYTKKETKKSIIGIYFLFFFCYKYLNVIIK